MTEHSTGKISTMSDEQLAEAIVYTKAYITAAHNRELDRMKQTQEERLGRLLIEQGRRTRAKQDKSTLADWKEYFTPAELSMIDSIIDREVFFEAESLEKIICVFRRIVAKEVGQNG